jgi:glycine cleavage system regulatory protein
VRKLLTGFVLILLCACRSEERAVPSDIRSAELRIVVDDTSKTVAAVTRSVEASGGYVAASQIWRDGELLRARLTLRVPADKLTETLAAIRAAAKRVDTETIRVSSHC